MSQWIKKLNQIWNSTKDVDDNIDDLVKASIKRNAIHQARLENHFIDPWIKQFPKPPDMNHEIAIENRKPPYVGIIKKYDDGEIRCDHNNYGFRCEDIEEKTDDDLVIVSLGCSFTYGAGVPVEDRWTDVLCKKIQEITKLKVRNYNLGLEGHTNDYCARTLYKTINELKPDLYCLLFTYRNRLEWITNEDGTVAQVIPGYDTNFINIMNDGIAMYNFNKNYALIDSLCRLYNVPFLFSTVDPLIDQTYRGLEHYVGKFIRDTKGMDGEHPGPISHAQLAEQFFDKYKQLL